MKKKMLSIISSLSISRKYFTVWTAPGPSQTMAVLKEQQLDLAVLDATFGFESLPGHMNFEIVAQLVDELCLEDKAIASHLSLHWVPPHSQSESWLAKRKSNLPTME